MARAGHKRSESSVTARLVELILKMSDDEKHSVLKELEERLFIRKRKYERKPYLSSVYYTNRDGAHIDCIENIGAGGVFISTHNPSHIGQELTMAFPLPISQEHIILSGEIAWVAENGTGVKFKMIDEKERNRIKSQVNMI